MNVVKAKLAGCLLLEPSIFNDDRGRFIKTYHRSTFTTLGIKSDFSEEYYSVSHKHVIRGLHFQTPPQDQYKLVYCVSGAVFDVVVDLRKDSPSYGQHCSFELSEKNGSMLYIPSGFAHGFCALEDNSVMMYRVSTEYSRECDTGILWNSLRIDWPTRTPIISKRDRQFCSFDTFESPFHYRGPSA